MANNNFIDLLLSDGGLWAQEQWITKYEIYSNAYAAY